MRMHGSLTNSIMADTKQPAPKVGDGATLLLYTDRHAATIVKVSDDGKEVEVQEDNEERTDNNGMSESQTYSFTPNDKGAKHTFTLRKNGGWIKKGEATKSGQRLSIGHRSSYHDYSF